jgi:hypothetical protein
MVIFLAAGAPAGPDFALSGLIMDRQNQQLLDRLRFGRGAQPPLRVLSRNCGNGAASHPASLRQEGEKGSNVQVENNLTEPYI